MQKKFDYLCFVGYTELQNRQWVWLQVKKVCQIPKAQEQQRFFGSQKPWESGLCLLSSGSGVRISGESPKKEVDTKRYLPLFSWDDKEIRKTKCGADERRLPPPGGKTLIFAYGKNANESPASHFLKGRWVANESLASSYSTNRPRVTPVRVTRKWVCPALKF